MVGSSSGDIINQVAIGGTGTVEAVPMVGDNSSSRYIINQVAVCGTGTGTVEAAPSLTPAPALEISLTR